ncbi:MAG TPA: 50S ribosomal protein L29 [Candidatus Paceibacterota bacterium]
MKTKDFIKKSDADLQKMLGEERKALRLFRFSLSGSKIKNIKEGSVARKNIARILTELYARQKGGVKAH